MVLSHEIFAEQVIQERRQEVEAIAARGRVDRTHDEHGVATFVRTLVPALTHGLMGIPTQPRTAAGGC